MGPSLGLSTGVAGLLSLLVGLVLAAVAAAALRTFVSGETGTIPGEHFTRNLGWMLPNLVVGGIAFAIVVSIGVALLVVPGVFLLVSLFFWSVFVVVEDENFVEGFSSSWELTRGHRLKLFALGVIVVIVAAVVGGVFGAFQAVLPGFAGLVVAQVGGAFGTVFGIATAARTYRQLALEETETS